MPKTNWANVNQWLAGLDVVADWSKEGELIWKLAEELKLLKPKELVTAASTVGWFNSQQRAKLLEALIISADAYFSKNLLMLIFGGEGLTTLYQQTRKAYPDFDLIMGARWGTHEYLELCAFFHPRKGGPGFNPSTDFSNRPNWDTWEYFWEGGKGGGKTQIEQMLEAYPTQSAIASKKKAEAWELQLNPDRDLFFVRDLVKAHAAV